jgi:hypothetical protein
MKSISKLLLAAGTAVILTSAARADEPLLSPRAKANQIKTVPGTSEDKLDRTIQPGSPKARELAYSVRKVSGTTEDKLDRSLATMSPKARELLGPRATEHQVAPLK